VPPMCRLVSDRHSKDTSIQTAHGDKLAIALHFPAHIVHQLASGNYLRTISSSDATPE
jgi:hypothetical protein